MRVSPPRNAFTRAVAEVYEPNTDIDCAICGKPVLWPQEEVAWDENNEICHAECVEEWRSRTMESNNNEKIASSELIVVRQLPVIEERLLSLKEKWEQTALDAEAMVCTADTIQAVKIFRAEMRKEFDDLEEQRKQVKKEVMGPYEQFLSVYMDCVVTAFKSADAIFSHKISDVETNMKRRCEEGLRDYFAELTAVHHLEWLTYERAGIRIDMASAKAKTPGKLRKQLVEFVAGVAESVDRINSLDDAAEIMVEFQKSLNAADAICRVQERRQRVKEQEAQREVRETVRAREAEAVRRVEALAPPVEVKQEKIFSMDFRAHGTLEQLKILKQFAAANGIKLEGIKHE